MINEEKSKIQEEAFNALREVDFNGAVLIATGTGKAKLIIDIIRYLQPKSALYLCDSKENRDKSFPDQILQWGEPWMFEVTDRKCYKTAYKYVGKTYDLLIADEGDFALTPQYSKVFFKNNFKHKVLLTGTYEDRKLPLLRKIVPLVYVKNAKEAEKAGAINKSHYYFVSYELTNLENKRYLNYNDEFKRLLNLPDQARYKYRIETLSRQRSIFLNNLDSSVQLTRDLIDNLLTVESNKVLVFAGCTEQADKISNYSYHTKSKKNYLEDFNNGVIREFVVVGKIDRGVNLKGVNNIIFTMPARSSTKASQRVGRAKRLGKDEISHIFFLIPYFKKRFSGELFPTVVQARILESSKDLDLRLLKRIRYDTKQRIFT